MEINEKIMVLRKRKGYSQEDLAHELDVSRQAVYKWESGESTPELDKIKKMSMLFDISFDDLLNDEVDITVEVKKEKTKKQEFKYRKVFRTNESFNTDAIELEHNYLYLDPSKNRYSYEIKPDGIDASVEEYKNKEKELNAFLEANGYTTDLRYKLLPDATGTIVIDKKKKALGFYFNGAIQFLCPLENIFDITVKTLMTEPVYEKQSKVGAILGGLVGVSVGSEAECVGNRATAYDIVISYFDENEESNQYKIKLDDIRYYSIYARDKEYGRTFAQYRDTLLFNMNNFIKRFAGAIDSIKAEADVLRQKPGKAEEFDFEKLNADYEAAKKVVDEKRTKLQTEWDKTVEKKKKANKIKTIVGLSVGGAIILFLIICGLIGA